MWQTIIHTVFILSAIGIAYVDRLSNDRLRRSQSRPRRIDGRCTLDQLEFAAFANSRSIAAVPDVGTAADARRGRPARAADAAFTAFIASLWPEAQAAGVSRATFDARRAGSSRITSCPI